MAEGTVSYQDDKNARPGDVSEWLDHPDRLVAFDQRHLWHPYAPTPAPVDPWPIVSTEGVWLRDAYGNELIDGMSSWWAAAHGHSHPDLVAAAKDQIDAMSHVMFGGLTHAPAVALADRLIGIAPAGLNRVFFADSGSVSVEVAHKMALQYQMGNGQPQRRRMLTWRGGYHGDTFAPMSVCDPEGGMHSLWRGVLPEQVFAPAPPARGATAEVRAAYVSEFASFIDETIAAVIIEPVVQGAGGMRFHDPELVAEISHLCNSRGVLLIADEIATGFGRTGVMFACEEARITPDIMCVGKALTGGFMTLAAVLATDAVAEAIGQPAGGGALMHGPTFMANPLACRVACASLDLLATGYWKQAVSRIEQQLEQGLQALAELPGVADVRVKGAIGVVEMTRPVDMKSTTRAAIDEGVWLRPFGTLIYTMPPYISTEAEVEQIIAGVSAAVRTASARADKGA